MYINIHDYSQFHIVSFHSVFCTYQISCVHDVYVYVMYMYMYACHTPNTRHMMQDYKLELKLCS